MLQFRNAICIVGWLMTVVGFSQTPAVISIAGSASWTFSGTGGPAVNAPIGIPQGVAVDAAGNLYLADSGNHLVAKISPSGILSVLAGLGSGSGDSILASQASLSAPVAV